MISEVSPAAGNDTVAAVLVTYNRKEFLSECLDGLLHQTRPVDRIILIDNASTDGTPEFLKQRGYLGNPVIDYVQMPDNTGGAGGFHEGVKRGYYAGYRWLWLMDDDVEPTARCFGDDAALCRALEVHSGGAESTPTVSRIPGSAGSISTSQGRDPASSKRSPETMRSFRLAVSKAC